jgi:Domain of unknown function (DUF4136)
VVVDWDHSAGTFSQFKTYAWVKPTRLTPNPLMDQRIVAAIDSQLAAKGMRKVDDSPDMFVTYGAGISQQTQTVVREQVADGDGAAAWRR